MPSIKANETVLVTGASGFIAVWVCRTLLEAGYNVNLSYPEAQCALPPKAIISSQTIHGQEGAFDEAVKGVHGIAHTASPFHFASEDPKDIIDPAIKGTTGVLESAHKFGSAVKRVVITSSVASVTDGMHHLKTPGTIYTENDWNTLSEKEIEEKGKYASGSEKYCASKTLAEKAAWEFVKNIKPNWDIATCCPSLVLGPFLHQVSNPNALNTSIATLYNFMHNKESISKEALLVPNFNFVHVQDIALAHVRALEVEEAGGQRFITSSGPFCWQDALDVLDLPPEFPRGIPGSGKALNHIVFSHTKANKMLGIEFKGLQECVRDTVKDLEKHGWGVMV
ncbi:NAD-P-binding protein [Rhizoctonia solani]|uniref:NAD-P-binding protein n=1 Tax=Rhizoctonia solani TaxID=456999 RepID=A0A8H7H287_9AGAM|nr:NAD-P-binding protein [Rhizoctonia solani]